MQDLGFRTLGFLGWKALRGEWAQIKFPLHSNSFLLQSLPCILSFNSCATIKDKAVASQVTTQFSLSFTHAQRISLYVSSHGCPVLCSPPRRTRRARRRSKKYRTDTLGSFEPVRFDNLHKSTNRGSCRYSNPISRSGP